MSPANRGYNTINYLNNYIKMKKYNFNAGPSMLPREVIDNGSIASGYYMMSPHANGINRYVLFSHTNKDKGAVIYIEGDLSPEDIMTICYTKRG